MLKRTSVGAALLVLLGLVVGCGEGARGPQAGKGEGAAVPSSEAVVSGGEELEEAGEVDEALAQRGEALFGTKGCVACHTVGKGRLVGPDLLGVTERREREWVLSMVMNPDSMLRADTAAKALLAQYYTPMTNMNVARDEARALYEFLRWRAEEVREGEGGGS